MQKVHWRLLKSPKRNLLKKMENKIKWLTRASIIKDVVIVLFVIGLLAVLLGKYLEATFFITCHVVLRKRYDKQFHYADDLKCLILSCVVGVLGIVFTLPLSWSILSTVPLVLLMCAIGQLAVEKKEIYNVLITSQDSLQRMKKTPSIHSMTKSEIVNLSEKKGLDINKIILHFIEKRPHNVIDNINPRRSEKERERLRKKLLS